MTDTAYAIFERAVTDQHIRNEARTILKQVREARGNPHAASLRWPFELLQNALDAGPREGRSYVTVHIHCEGDKIRFQHDGAPFTSADLAALLSGGSSKEFESTETTGRFGTGFLATHVLDSRARVCGLLNVLSGLEAFELHIDRSGDEAAIIENIRSCNEAVRRANPVSEVGTYPSAAFEYPISENTPLLIGIDALRSALPYLYGTRPSLGSVEIRLANGAIETWTAQPASVENLRDAHIERRAICVSEPRGQAQRFIVYRFMVERHAGAAALILLKQVENRWHAHVPEAGAPRIFREYPIRGSGFLPLTLVLDGKFEPDPERVRLQMTQQDWELIEQALLAGVLGVKYAFEQRWDGAHQLAVASKPQGCFDPTNPEETPRWIKCLSAYADRLARLKIIDCGQSLLAAIGEEQEAVADFIVPRLVPSSPKDETTIDRMWPLCAATTDLCVPRRELASDWSRIAEGWHGLGVQLSRLTLAGVADYIRHGDGTVAGLAVEQDPKDWLARFLDLVGECWTNRAGVEVSVLTGLVPTQSGRLLSPRDLKRDEGIPTRLKDICHSVGLDVRQMLLFDGFQEIAAREGFLYLERMISEAVPASLSEDNVLELALTHLDKKLPEDHVLEAKTEDLQKASVELLVYVWDSKGVEGADFARRMPLISTDARSVRWSAERSMMAPVCTWPKTARLFARAYPPTRVLADLYAGFEIGERAVPSGVPALVEWEIAIPEPLTTDRPAEVKDRRLAAISATDSDGVIVSGVDFSQIALLPREVLNRCQEGIEEARALLGLVLCHIAPSDMAWRQEKLVSGRRSRDDIEVRLRPSLWLADLKYRTWVPVQDEHGKLAKMDANPTTLAPLLDPAWLVDNDCGITLLSECFGFDELDLRLRSAAPDTEQLKAIRSGLAKLVEYAGGDADLYTALAKQMEAQRDRERHIAQCKQLGLAIQDAIRMAFENYGLNLKLVDRGFDYEVAFPPEHALEDASTKFEVGPYLLEVKATTSGRPRLTPTQAQSASLEAHRYILCVVDLRHLSEAELQHEWDRTRVEPLARLVLGIGGTVQETCELVEAAASQSIAIRNEGALRYEVPPTIWEQGISIAEWVSGVRSIISVR